MTKGSLTLHGDGNSVPNGHLFFLFNGKINSYTEKMSKPFTDAGGKMLKRESKDKGGYRHKCSGAWLSRDAQSQRVKPSGNMAASATMTDEDSRWELGDGLSVNDADIMSQFEQTIPVLNE